MIKLDKRYALASDPIFWTIQGEGHLRGFQMAFLRLAGCSVGCRQCDTDYVRHGALVSAAECAARVAACIPRESRDKWVWLTGGEPADVDLRPLIAALKQQNLSVCVASSGIHRVTHPVDWLSISPHCLNTQQLYGNEIKLIEGLNGLSITDWVDKFPDSTTDFWYRYVQPLSVDGVEQPESLQRCLSFIRDNPNWSISRQDHVYWGVK